MKTVIYLIAIIGWAVLQARRKALREQKRKQAAAERTGTVPQPSARNAAVLGPVSAEENRLVDRAQPIRYSRPVDERPSYLAMPAEDIQAAIETVKAESQKKRKKKKAQPENEEKVEEVVVPFDMGPDAYTQTATVRRRISFDADSLRTFVVTREILGPPRAKRPHRPGMKEI